MGSSTPSEEPSAGARVAIVTGAGSGIGEAVAAALAAKGIAVTCADLSAERAHATARAIMAAGGTAHGMEIDVSDQPSRAELVSGTLARFGRLDILVNNAGIIDYAGVLELTEAAWDHVIDVNLKAAFFCAQTAATAMVDSGRGGVIVNITSISAELPEPDCIHYGVSKAGLAYLTRTLALGLATHGIRVVAVAPGTIRTPMNRDLLSDPAVVEARLATIPIRQLGAPSDIAAAVAFLASDAAGYITGSTLYVEGGIMLVR